VTLEQARTNLDDAISAWVDAVIADADEPLTVLPTGWVLTVGTTVLDDPGGSIVLRDRSDGMRDYMELGLLDYAVTCARDEAHCPCGQDEA
jgi:hypothetical protein